MSTPELFGILSLLWVVGLFTLQRLDKIWADYISALRVYLAVQKDGGIRMDQLTIKQAFTSAGIMASVDALLKHGSRPELVAAQKMRRAHHVMQFGFESLLVVITLLLPIVYYVDFSQIEWLSVFEKRQFLYLCLVTVFFSSLIIQRVSSYLGGKFTLLAVVVNKGASF